MDRLAEEISTFIKSAAGGDEDNFNRLARELFARQYECNIPYRRFCDSCGVTPARVTLWQDIPAVPASGFKMFDLTCVPPERAVAEFHSSGTSGANTSRHILDRDALELYEISLKTGFREAIPQIPTRLWALMPPPAEAPHSSLSLMLGALDAERYFWNNDSGLAKALASLAEPVALFGTAFAFVQLFDSSEAHWPLPPGSVVIETGGFKGRTREVPRAEFYRLLATRFALPFDSCYSEYGMSEMTSQFYGRGLDPTKRGPHWVRTRCIDPVTGDDASYGTAGVLRHYDLANFNSVMAIQTQDLAIMTRDGFELQGRASHAEVRGCSLTVEELWQST